MVSREQFSSKFGFVMAAAGSAIGLGNIWGFPTQTASNGGAIFVLVYLAMAFTLAYPALMAELIIGRHAKANIFTALRGISPNRFTRLFGGCVGIYGILTASLILSFYGIVAGWVIAYLAEAVTNLLGWEQASRWFLDFSITRNLITLSVFMVLTITIVASGVTNGIEKWSTRLMPMLLVILLALIAYVMTQDGAMEGLKVYLLPDISLITPELILNALGQAFFSLSLGVGTMLIYGSYVSSQENLPKLGAMVTLVDTGTAFIAGLLIIPAVYVAQTHGTAIFTADGSLIAGPDLIFQVLPSLFNSMGQVGLLVALAFFVLLLIASLTSSISILEVPVSLTVEETALSRTQATWLLGTVIFLCSAVILLSFDTLFDVVVTLTTVYSQPLLGLMMCVFAGWFLHRNSLLQQIKAGNPDAENGFFWKIWPTYVKFICPLLILATLTQSLRG
jgi:NSS family neurotransmitter:Na+ symporter